MIVEFRRLLPQYSVLQPQKMELTRNLRHVASKIAKFQNRSAPRLQRWHRRGRNVKTFPVSASSSKSLQGFVAAWISWISSGRNFGRHSNPTCSQSAVQWGVQVDAQPTWKRNTRKVFVSLLEAQPCHLTINCRSSFMFFPKASFSRMSSWYNFLAVKHFVGCVPHLPLWGIQAF